MISTLVLIYNSKVLFECVCNCVLFTFVKLLRSGFMLFVPVMRFVLLTFSLEEIISKSELNFL